MNQLQQNALITYITTHERNCECVDCKHFGGTEGLMQTFLPEFFTDNHLRRIYNWILIQYQKYGNCELAKLNFDDPTAPKLSEITQCHIGSYVEDKNISYTPLREIITI